jgi:hypothetical protein
MEVENEATARRRWRAVLEFERRAGGLDAPVV